MECYLLWCKGKAGPVSGFRYFFEKFGVNADFNPPFSAGGVLRQPETLLLYHFSCRFRPVATSKKIRFPASFLLSTNGTGHLMSFILYLVIILITLVIIIAHSLAVRITPVCYSLPGMDERDA